MIMSEIGLHSFSTYIITFVHEERLAMSCENNKIMDHQKSHLFSGFLYKLQILMIRTILQKLHRYILAFCSHIDLCIVHLHFSTWMEPAIIYNRRAHTLFHVLHANLCLFWCSIPVYRCRMRTRYETNT